MTQQTISEILKKTESKTSASTSGKIAILSTYPPTECGIASFAKSLESALSANGLLVDVVRLSESSADSLATSVVANHSGKSAISQTVELLNQYDQVIIQHEFGIFDGEDGDEIVDIIDQLQIPTSVVLHTVLTKPTLRQRVILNFICAKADALITMTQAGKAKLIANYDVDVSKIFVIGHGAREIITPPLNTQRLFRNDAYLV